MTVLEVHSKCMAFRSQSDARSRRPSRRLLLDIATDSRIQYNSHRSSIWRSSTNFRRRRRIDINGQSSRWVYTSTIDTLQKGTDVEGGYKVVVGHPVPHRQLVCAQLIYDDPNVVDVTGKHSRWRRFSKSCPGAKGVVQLRGLVWNYGRQFPSTRIDGPLHGCSDARLRSSGKDQRLLSLNTRTTGSFLRSFVPSFVCSITIHVSF